MPKACVHVSRGNQAGRGKINGNVVIRYWLRVVKERLGCDGVNREHNGMHIWIIIPATVIICPVLFNLIWRPEGSETESAQEYLLT